MSRHGDEKGNYVGVGLSDLDQFSDGSDCEDGNPPPRISGSSSTSNSRRGDTYASQSVQRQRQMLQEQDEGLDMLAQSAERLGQLSMGINSELQGQNQILDDMDEDFGQAAENLDIVTRKTKEFIAASGGTKNFAIIVCLSLIVVFLLILIIYF